MSDFSLLDLIAIGWYVFAWAGFGWLTDYSRWHRGSLSRLMDQHRRSWMKGLQTREVRMVDTAIMGSLQNGTAFFASTSLLALGATLTLLNQSDRVFSIVGELPLPHQFASKQALELKVLGLAVVYGYAFFKFGWAYRLYNYAAILIGAIPPLTEGRGSGAAGDGAGRRNADPRRPSFPLGSPVAVLFDRLSRLVPRPLCVFCDVDTDRHRHDASPILVAGAQGAA